MVCGNGKTVEMSDFLCIKLQVYEFLCGKGDLCAYELKVSKWTIKLRTEGNGNEDLLVTLFKFSTFSKRNYIQHQDVIGHC